MSACLVSIVTWNSEDWLERCLASVSRQTTPVRIRVFDNNSADDSVAVARKFTSDIVVAHRNVGFSAGHNHNLQADPDWRRVLLLNPDTRLAPDYVERLLAGMDRQDRVGSAGGKLLRMDSSGEEMRSGNLPVLDSTGIYFTPSLRHLDRDSGQRDPGVRDQAEDVFGITGAALLCSREFVADVAWKSEFLDEAFFAYREDADLAWRARILGWRAAYEPGARAWHARHVRPELRSHLSPAVNFHSVKNRFLMRIKNLDPEVRRRCFPHYLLRDLGIFAYLVTRERSSIPALAEVRRLRPLMREKRRWIQSRRRVSGSEMASWFSNQPVSRPL